jgi:DNA polymerase alpha subunit A
MKTLNVTHWHKLGRLKAYRWPKLHPGSGGSGVITYQERLFMTGRLVCDTHIASKDLVSSKSYHLSKLVSFQLNILREDIQTSALCRYFSDNAGIIQLAKHCSFDAFLSYALMVKLQILPLTKQLTNLSGNLWSRSMHGARSERNEYLLLHNFYKHQFICPDKGGFKGKRDLQFVDEDLGKMKYFYKLMQLELLTFSLNIELEMPAKKKQKGPNGKAEASYSGGLVLEPKTGFYDKYVLLLDFNSLYPSIMQEYNVCFTSMGGQPDNGITLNTPSSQKPIGILPELVKTFVQQRQRIKRLMADPNLSKSTKAQYNIEQMALKLTANSMYGCLGSSISRFYAKPLAMFITAKGREILQATADLATHSGLDVIYGDTDSVMINTNQVNMANAKSIGETFKQRVNQNYKQLEIEIDGFFRHTLLLRKKKYAALLVKEKPNGSLQESIEVKGLDLVRRDWCDLSHGVSE